SFADIFRNNALKNGLVPVELDDATTGALVALVRDDPATEIAVDIERRTIEAPHIRSPFPLDDHSRLCLLEGLDDIALTLRHEPEIVAYEAKRAEWMPRVR